MDGETIPGFKRYIQSYTPVEFSWGIVKPWFPVNIEKIQKWYHDLEKNYGDWKFVYSQHKYMWKDDPGDPTGKTGHRFMPDTAWYTLCWNGNNQGPLPPERGEALPEWRDIDQDELYPRECFNGYALEVVRNLPIRSKRWIISIHTPGTKLIMHQDSPDKIRVHIPIYSDKDSVWIIDGKEYFFEPGFAYLVNTTLPHSVENIGNKNRVHLYGKVWTEDCKSI